MEKLGGAHCAIILLVCLLMPRLSNAQTCNAQDSQALLDFKNQFDDPEGVFSTWASGTNCCQWDGITCDSSTGRVVQIFLFAPPPDRGFTNPTRKQTVPAAQVGVPLGRLSALTGLEIGNIFFDGSVPPQWGTLTNLERLTVQLCHIQGPLPKELGKLYKLTKIQAILNSITGHLATEFCNLTKLQSLDLSNNQMDGFLPSCIPSSWKDIQQIFLLSNSFTGKLFPNIGELKALKQLDLGNNNFYGSLPNSIDQLTNLETLTFSSNKFGGAVPDTMRSLQSLESLLLNGNYFSGTIPGFLSQLNSLLNVDLSSNYFTGTIPSSLGNAPVLSTVVLAKNKLSGQIPPSLGNLKGPGLLNLSSNYLSGPLPPALGNYAQGNLDVSHNFLTGGFPLSYARLTEVDVSFNKLTGSPIGSIPTDGSDELRFLNLGSNLIQGPVPSWLADLSNLLSLDASNNKISGSIPDKLYLLNIQLNFSNNPLNIQLPTSLQGGPSPLTSLDLHNCGLFGPITSSFFTSFGNILVLDLSFNKLSGPLPSDTGSSLNSGITYLDLSDNKLNGTVPVELQPGSGAFPILTFLDLSNNEFTGNVPKRP